MINLVTQTSLHQAMRMAKKVEFLAKMDKAGGEEDEDEDELSELPGMRLSVGFR